MLSDKAMRWEAISPSEYQNIYGNLTEEYLDGYYIISDEPEEDGVPWLIASTKEGIPGTPADMIAEQIVEKHNRIVDKEQKEDSPVPEMNLYFIVTQLALDNKYVAASNFSEAAEIFNKYAQVNARAKEILRIELVSRGLLREYVNE